MKITTRAQVTLKLNFNDTLNFSNVHKLNKKEMRGISIEMRGT